MCKLISYTKISIKSQEAFRIIASEGLLGRHHQILNSTVPAPPLFKPHQYQKRATHRLGLSVVRHYIFLRLLSHDICALPFYNCWLLYYNKKGQSQRKAIRSFN
ncbi:hypothetical protein FGO68_gene1506 [Halteria grandinella]|uniref:Uncharacterized protein n=1 Tax=Halteria grandinella TaxID=5974 RepID=A0A8J8T9G8_HALGN|nr:hypothetical protein FGO68_gene1506 [Halteria grandinella]